METQTKDVPHAVAANVMVLIGEEHYQAGNGFSARREQGVTPNGIPVGGRWDLRNPQGEWVDVDQWRLDLFERNGLTKR